MRPVAVVLDVPMDDRCEVASPEYEHSVQTFTPDSAHEALSEGVGTGSPNRGSDGPDAIGGEDLVESGCELGVAIANQEPDRSCTLGEFIGQVPGLLDDPCSSGMSGNSGHVHFRVSSSMKNRT